MSRQGQPSERAGMLGANQQQPEFDNVESTYDAMESGSR